MTNESMEIHSGVLSSCAIFCMEGLEVLAACAPFLDSSRRVLVMAAPQQQQPPWFGRALYAYRQRLDKEWHTFSVLRDSFLDRIVSRMMFATPGLLAISESTHVTCVTMLDDCKVYQVSHGKQVSDCDSRHDSFSRELRDTIACWWLLSTSLVPTSHNGCFRSCILLSSLPFYSAIYIQFAHHVLLYVYTD
jgi:hypothetical protein